MLAPRKALQKCSHPPSPEPGQGAQFGASGRAGGQCPPLPQPCSEHQGLAWRWEWLSIKIILPPCAPALSTALEMFLHLILCVIMCWLAGEAALAGLLIFQAALTKQERRGGRNYPSLVGAIHHAQRVFFVPSTRLEQGCVGCCSAGHHKVSPQGPRLVALPRPSFCCVLLPAPVRRNASDLCLWG